MEALRINIIMLLLPVTVWAQSADSLLMMLDNEMQQQTEVITATFKLGRIINCHSVEQMGKGDFDFRIHHRFGEINGGINDFFGLDYSASHLMLDYGITDRITTGVGRTTWKKTWTGLLKCSVFRQTTGKKAFPVTITYVSSVFAHTLDWEQPGRENYFWSRFGFAHQVLIARKINADFSVQISPSLLHRNLTETREQPNDIWFAGIAGRYRLTKRVAVTSEYLYIFTRHFSPPGDYSMPLSLGLDIETGGHVFQLLVSNAAATSEDALITNTSGKWKKGQVRFGFNISRVF